MQLAYLSRGRLFLKDGDAAEALVESRFGREAINRAAQMQEKRAWKVANRNSMFLTGGALWNVADANAALVPVRITAVTRGREPGQLLFALDTGGVGGLFEYAWARDDERRLLHKERFSIRDLDRNPATGAVIGSRFFENRTARLLLMDAEGGNWQELTEGDSVDESPRWIPGAADEVVFQSAGVGRNEAGQAVALAPYSIQRLNIKTGSLQTLAEDAGCDFLLPRMNAAGDLFFLRRPYAPHGWTRPTGWRLLADFLLIPVRLVRALFHFLNFFSVFFARKPLTTAGGPKVEGPDLSLVVLRGRMVDTEAALRSAGDRDTGALVPKDWQLVRRPASGAEEVLADGVVCFDLAPDGAVVYSNGTAIFRRDAGGRRETLVKGKLVEDLAVLG